MDNSPKNKVLVVGAGPAGMEASLVLAAMGRNVVLSDIAPAIGGLFPLLDNQFPTQSCGVCFMACQTPTYCPFVQCDLHENIEVLPSSSVVGAKGGAGDFSVDLKQSPTCVDRDKCTDCGACEAVCPVSVAREFGDGLETRKAVYRYYPKNVGKGYVVDAANCTRCGECVKVCAPNAIDLNQQGGSLNLEVGSVVLAPGASLLDAAKKGEYGFNRYANVFSAAKFERMLSKDGPTGGEVVRPSDQATPKSLAFVQCVGSRDPANGRPYCSSVCCMFALKHALFVKERHPQMRVVMFYMDLRAFGKDYEKYIDKAKALGVEFIRSIPSIARLVPKTGDLVLATAGEGINLREETFNMVVLSSGFELGPETARLAGVFGVNAIPGGIEADGEFTPCQTSTPGVFAAGMFRGPKDIPEAVQEGAASALLANGFLDKADMADESFAPTPVDFRDEAPSVGVVVCDCEGYTSKCLDLSSLEARIAKLGGVKFVERVSHACSKPGMNEVRGIFAKNEPNRLVLASCTHRIVGDLYRHMFKDMGVSPEVFEAGDLRMVARSGNQDQALSEVSRAVTKCLRQEFKAPEKKSIQRSALVVGGGVAGMASALSLAAQGIPVHLVEKSSKLGGNLNSSHFTVRGGDTNALLADLTDKISKNADIKVYLSAKIKGATGKFGGFRTTVETPESVVEILHGAVLLATGASEAKPKSFGYGANPKVVTQKEFEKILATGGFDGGKVVMIQCVESRRSEEGMRPYCSRVCCTHAIKNALKAKGQKPDAGITVLYRDLRAYGNYEKNYEAARKAGTLFVAYDLTKEPKVSADASGISVEYYEPALKQTVKEKADWLVLSNGMAPDAAEVSRLAKMFGVEADSNAFFTEKSKKAAVTDFVKPGFYMAGLAHAPKHIEETLVQAAAASARLGAVLSVTSLAAPLNASYVVDKICSRCGLCVETCPYGARELDMTLNMAVVDGTLCKACGACVTVCPNKAARQYGTNPGQVMAELDELLY